MSFFTVIFVIVTVVFESDPVTLVQESNDLQMMARPKLTAAHYAYLGVGAKLTIQRTGVIKQWRFYSPAAGWTVFQVWRPDPSGGEFR